MLRHDDIGPQVEGALVPCRFHRLGKPLDEHLAIEEALTAKAGKRQMMSIPRYIPALTMDLQAVVHGVRLRSAGILGAIAQPNKLARSDQTDRGNYE